MTPGFSPQLLSLFNSRYPMPTICPLATASTRAVIIFNAPEPYTINTYTTRVDYDLTSKQKLFTRFTFYNQHAIHTGLPSIQFPG